MEMSDPIVIIGSARTPMGAMQGALSHVTAPALGAAAIAGALAKASVNAADVGGCYMGCVLQAGLKQAPARQAAIYAGLNASTVTTTINKVCGSGMKAVMMACDDLVLGRHEFVVAGGMENMSLAPHLLSKARAGYRLGHAQALDHLFTDGLEDAYSGELMGLLADKAAALKGFSRHQQDAFALSSVHDALEAQSTGAFDDEIVPVATAKGEVLIDELPTKAKPDKMPALKPVFRSEGTITAANASAIADGAAALVLCRKSTAVAKGLNICGEIVSFSEFAGSPEMFTLAPISAISEALAAAKLAPADIGVWEINEAFAMVPLAAVEALGLNPVQVNIYGGACALGHPLGASGARILVTLLSAMRARGSNTGVAALCIGGGEGIAMVLRAP